MNAFESATAKFEQDLAAQSSQESKQEQVTPQSDQSPQQASEAQVAQAIAEIEKMEKFKFQGQEWTPKDLEKAILRQKDYTQKTQAISSEKKSLEDERKYYENLAWDLMKVRDNPDLAQAFIQTYPEKFHAALAEFLKTGQVNTPPQGQQSVQPQKPQVDVQLMSRLERMEKFFNEQEVSRHEQEVSRNEEQIKATIADLSKQYPNAANFQEMVLGRAYEAHSSGVTLTKDAWESIFKQVDKEVDSIVKAKYSEIVKKQSEVNAKSRDVGSGGGIAGQAPKKFSKLSDVTKFAIDDLTRAKN